MNQSPQKILIVEDETVIALEIEEHLERFGYEVVSHVTCGEDVLEEVKEHHPNLVLMDINLKGNITGIDAARQLRSFSNIPVIFLTAYGDKKMLEDAKQVSPHGFLTKPFRSQELNASIELGLMRYKTEEDLRIKQEHFKNLAKKNTDTLQATIPDLMEILLENPIHEKLWEDEKEVLSTISKNIDIIKEHQDSLLKVKNEAKDETDSQLKNEFISRISHEFRTPLNSIMGFSQILSSEKDNPLSDSQKEKLNCIISSGNHILRLVNNILDQNSIENGSMDMKLEEVSLNRLIEESFEEVKESAIAKRLNVIDETSSNEEVWVSADEGHLKRVLVNLLTNAIKYNQHNGSIGVSIEFNVPQTARLKISDTGIGISEERQKQIFEPFNSINPTTGFKDGIGLSLNVSKLLIERMYGKISFDSQIDKGCNFYIELPILKKRPVSEKSKSNIIKNHNATIDQENEDEAKISKISISKEIRLDFLKAAETYNYTKLDNLINSLNP